MRAHNDHHSVQPQPHAAQASAAPKSSTASTVVALAIALACLVLTLIAISLTNMPAYHVDYLYAIEFLRDLAQQKTNLAWVTPPSPYFFPDFLFVAIAMGLTLPFDLPPTSDIAAIFILTFILHITGLILACAWLLRETHPRWTNTTSHIAAIVAVTFYLLSQLASPLYAENTFFPVGHSNALLIAIVLIAWVIRLFRQNKRYATIRAVLVFITLGAATAFSDPLLITQTLIPLAILALIRKHIPLLGLIALTIALGLALLPLLHTLDRIRSPQFPNHIGFESVSIFINHIPELFSFWVWSINIAIVAILALWIITHKNRRQQFSQNQPLTNFTLFAIIATATTIAGPILLGRWEAVAHQRYMFPLYLLPVLWLPIAIMPSQPHSHLKKIAGRAAILLTACLTLIITIPIITAHDFRQPLNPKPILVQTLDQWASTQTDITTDQPIHGLADYWRTRNTNMYTDGHVAVLPLHPELKTNPWIMDMTHYFTPQRQQPQYHFIITTFLNGPKIIEKFGTPDHVLSVTTDPTTYHPVARQEQIWIYNQPLDTADFIEHLRTDFPSKKTHLVERFGPPTPPLSPPLPPHISPPHFPSTDPASLIPQTNPD